jgi:hypothetical protein
MSHAVKENKVFLFFLQRTMRCALGYPFHNITHHTYIILYVGRGTAHWDLNENSYSGQPTNIHHGSCLEKRVTMRKLLASVVRRLGLYGVSVFGSGLSKNWFKVHE